MSTQEPGPRGPDTSSSKLGQATSTSPEAEETLRRQAQILAQVHEAIISTDLDGLIVEWNPAAERMFGYSSEEAVGRPVSIVWPPDQLAFLMEEIQPQVSEKGWHETEARHRNKFGDEFPVHLSLAALKDSKGVVVGMTGSVLDITERKRGEAIVAARLRLLEFAISHTPAEMLRATLDEAEALTGSQVGFCCFVDAGQIALSLGAWSTNTVRHMDKAGGSELRYSVDQADICVDCIRKRGPVIHQGPTPLPHREGSREGHLPVVRVLVVPVMRGEAVVAVLGVGNKPADYDEHDMHMVATLADLAWDIAEKKRAEDALRQNRTLLEAIVNGTTDAVYAKDIEGRYLLLNTAAEAFVGKRAADVLGKDDYCLFPSTEAAVVMEGDRKVMAQGETATCEETVTGAKGTTSTFLSTKGPLFDEEGALRGLFGIARDITERKQVEQYQETVPEILQILNEPGDLKNAAHRALAALKKATGFEALGIRLKEGDDFPYLAQDGFPLDFLQTENTLVKTSPDGGLCLDENGLVSLECTCGLVISGKTDPADPLISPGGSFWTNDSFTMLDLPPDEDPRTSPRNRCMHCGFASMALVPIRTRAGIVGLLQLNDRPKGRFTLETVEVLEDIASHLGAALMRKRAEEALRRSQELLSLYLRHSPVYTYIKEVTPSESRVLEASDNFRDMIGISGQEMTGRTMRELFPPDFAAKIADDDWSVVSSGAILQVDEDLNDRHYTTIKFSIDQGDRKLLAGYTIDITDRRHSEEARAESERALAALMANLPGVAYRCLNDRQWTTLFMSEGCEELTGYRPVDLMNRALPSYADLIHPDDRQMVWQAVQAGVSARKRFRVRYRIIAADGETRWVWEQGQGVFDEDDSLLCLEGFITDVTDRVRAEEALRTTEEHLRQSQKMEAVGQLAGGIAHDFNNLLTAIIGYSDLLLTGSALTDSPARQDIGQIKRAAERAATLTRQILAFSRRQTMRPAVASLNEVVTGMESLLRRTLGEHIDLASYPDPDLGHSEIDVHQFEQVLMNLALNARDAMPQGGRLTLETANVELDEGYCRTHAEAKPGSYVVLAVSDTGIGMDEVTRSRVFEPFFTTKAPGEGTGLGLATAYGVVKQNGGSVSVYSEPGKGTTFRIYLPRVTAPVQERAWAATDSSASVRGDETILVVEDEAALRNLATRILSDSGYQILSAGTVAEALQVAAEADFKLDLLVTDLVLPGGLQGKDLVLKLHSCLPDLPILYMSGYTRDAISHGGRLDENINFLEKPFGPADLVRTVRQVLDRSQR